MKHDTAFPQLDLEASLKKLADWLSQRKNAKYNHTEDTRRHHGLAKRLRVMAATLEEDEWFYLEEAFNENPPPSIGRDGMPIPCVGDNAGRYKALVRYLGDLADVADRMADENPKSRTKPELPMAADFFLHLWREAGKDKPSLYDSSDAVTALRNVLMDAGYPLSSERVRGLLSDAFEKFDPHYCLDQWQLERFMVWRQ